VIIITLKYSLVDTSNEIVDDLQLLITGEDTFSRTCDTLPFDVKALYMGRGERLFSVKYSVRMASRGELDATNLPQFLRIMKADVPQSEIDGTMIICALHYHNYITLDEARRVIKDHRDTDSIGIIDYLFCGSDISILPNSAVMDALCIFYSVALISKEKLSVLMKNYSFPETLFEYFCCMPRRDGVLNILLENTIIRVCGKKLNEYDTSSMHQGAINRLTHLLDNLDEV